MLYDRAVERLRVEPTDRRRERDSVVPVPGERAERSLDPGDGSRRLVARSDTQHAAPVRSKQRFSQTHTVAHRQGLLPIAAFDSNDDGGTPDPRGGYPGLPHTPHFNAKSR